MAATNAQWIIPFAVQLLPGGLLIIGMFFVPESPRYVRELDPVHCSTDIVSGGSPSIGPAMLPVQRS